MRVWLTLVRRELAGYFVSWTGYTVIAVVAFLFGLSFFILLNQLNLSESDKPLTEMFYDSLSLFESQFQHSLHLFRIQCRWNVFMVVDMRPDDGAAEIGCSLTTTIQMPQEISKADSMVLDGGTSQSAATLPHVRIDIANAEVRQVLRSSQRSE